MRSFVIFATDGKFPRFEVVGKDLCEAFLFVVFGVDDGEGEGPVVYLGLIGAAAAVGVAAAEDVVAEGWWGGGGFLREGCARLYDGTEEDCGEWCDADVHGGRFVKIVFLS